ncbi:MAG: LytTR family DNA-binding domain-containing protein [Cyclobacteriaceae bacterium]
MYLSAKTFPITDLKKLQLSLPVHFVRTGVILFLALILCHIFSYGMLPFQSGYQFPLMNFLVTSLFGFLVCSANWVIVPSTFQEFWETEKKKFKDLYSPFSKHWIFTVVLYTLLYVIINMGYFGYKFYLVGFLKYMMVILGIITIEFAFLVAFRLLHDQKINKSILIKSGVKTVNVKFEEISHFHSAGGIVSLFLKSGDKLITQFNSLEEVEKQYGCKWFFKLNRQHLVHHNAIHQVFKDRNRKLQVQLNTPSNNGNPKIVISRYRNKEFKQWFETASPV